MVASARIAKSVNFCSKPGFFQDPWTEIGNDTRNIASWPLLVAVLDEQDTPPVFTLAPPTTLLKPSLRPGDVVLSVHAEDGDRGKPRNIRYGLVSEGNPFTSFFNMSEDTGRWRVEDYVLIQELTFRARLHDMQVPEHVPSLQNK